jgi:hypothetical protein
MQQQRHYQGLTPLCCCASRSGNLWGRSDPQGTCLAFDSGSGTNKQDMVDSKDQSILKNRNHWLLFVKNEAVCTISLARPFREREHSMIESHEITGARVMSE